VSELLAPAKLNLALVVGPTRPDGKHEVATVLQRITLADTLALEAAPELEVQGFPEDTLVRRALESFADLAGAQPGWRVTIKKRIPVAVGLGGGSSDAAAALRLANESLDEPLAGHELHGLAAELGADVPFFLTAGPQLGEGDGTRLTSLDLPQDYWIVVLVPHGERKASTAVVYEDFDRRGGAGGFEERRAALHEGLVRGDLVALPANDLASSPLAEELVERGAFRADVTGAGPAVYGLFVEESEAVAAQASLASRGDVWIAAPAW
jgi:4-diphosphocytidyl-2-C-methyl-D-erythritol kinase